MKILEISIGDELYPTQLQVLENPPQKLYAMGNVSLLKEDMFSVVGTRRITDYGKKYGGDICKELIMRGIPLVSRFSCWDRYTCT